MKKYIKLCSIIAAPLMMLLFSNSALADYKVFHGSECQPFNPAVGDILYPLGGILNNGAAAQLVSCPIMRDDVPGAVGPDVAITVAATAVTNCVLVNSTLGGVLGPFVALASGAGAYGAGVVLATVPATPYTLLCQLPPGVALTAYLTNEIDLTDGPN